MCLDLLTRMDGKLHRLPCGIISTSRCSWEFLIETRGRTDPVKVPTSTDTDPYQCHFAGCALVAPESAERHLCFRRVLLKETANKGKNTEWKASESLHDPAQYLFLFHNSFAFLHLFFFLNPCLTKLWCGLGFFFLLFSPLKAYSTKYGKPQF